MTDPTVSFAAFCTPVSDGAPSGDNLEYSAEFLALEGALRGTPDVEYGATRTAAEPPDWQAVHALALALMARTRDLRIAVALTRASLALHGIAGLTHGLGLLACLMAQQWDTVHPQLEADDDFDPMLRINVLSALAAPSQLLRELRTTPLVQVRALGSYSLRDLDGARDEAREQARGDDVSGSPSVSMAMIDAAFAASGQDDLAATCSQLQEAIASVHVIEEQLARHVGAGQGLDLSPLATLLGQALGAVSGHLQAGIDAVGITPAVPAPGATTVATDAVAGRADVIRLLDRLCVYYDEHEPASPVPLLLQRARRLVGKGFAELLQDLAPDGLGQLSRVSGVHYES